MRCLGITKNFKRCKNDANGIFCRHHKFQPILFIFSTIIAIGGIGGAYTDVFFPIYQELFAVKENKENTNQKTEYKFKSEMHTDIERELRDDARRFRHHAKAKTVVLAAKSLETNEVIAVRSSESLSGTIVRDQNTSELRWWALNYQFEPAGLIAPFIAAESLDKTSHDKISNQIMDYKSEIQINKNYSLIDIETAPPNPTIGDYLIGKSQTAGFFLTEKIDFEEFRRKLGSIGLINLEPLNLFKNDDPLKPLNKVSKASFSKGYGIRFSVQSLLNGFSQLVVNTPSSTWSSQSRNKIFQFLKRENYSIFESITKKHQVITAGLRTIRPTFDGKSRAYNKKNQLYISILTYPIEAPTHIVVSLIDSPKNEVPDNYLDWSSLSLEQIVQLVEENNWGISEE